MNSPAASGWTRTASGSANGSGELGIRVMYHSTVADDLAANVAVFRSAVERADIVVATGGLGPTADDLTREVLAEVAGRPLVLDEASLEYIRGLFARFKRDMPERNRVQAMFPEGSQIIHNPNGTAPGIWIDMPRATGGVCHLFALPGVPAELFEMFRATVAPAVLSYQDLPRLIRHYRVKVFGAGESHVEQMLPDLIRRGRAALGRDHRFRRHDHAADHGQRRDAGSMSRHDRSHRRHDSRVPGTPGLWR